MCTKQRSEKLLTKKIKSSISACKLIVSRKNSRSLGRKEGIYHEKKLKIFVA